MLGKAAADRSDMDGRCGRFPGVVQRQHAVPPWTSGAIIAVGKQLKRLR
jgi:hypothetical protein